MHQQLHYIIDIWRLRSLSTFHSLQFPLSCIQTLRHRWKQWKRRRSENMQNSYRDSQSCSFTSLLFVLRTEAEQLCPPQSDRSFSTERFSAFSEIKQMIFWSCRIMSVSNSSVWKKWQPTDEHLMFLLWTAPLTPSGFICLPEGNPVLSLLIVWRPSAASSVWAAGEASSPVRNTRPGASLTSSLGLQLLQTGLHPLQLGLTVDGLSRTEPGQAGQGQQQQDGETARHVEGQKRTEGLLVYIGSLYGRWPRVSVDSVGQCWLCASDW